MKKPKIINIKTPPTDKALKVARIFGDKIHDMPRKGVAGAAVCDPPWRAYFAGREEEFYEDFARELDHFAWLAVQEELLASDKLKK